MTNTERALLAIPIPSSGWSVICRNFRNIAPICLILGAIFFTTAPTNSSVLAQTRYLSRERCAHEIYIKFKTRLFNDIPAKVENRFQDVHGSAKDNVAIIAVVHKNLMIGNPDNKFEPTEPLFRYQLATVLQRLVNLLAEQSHTRNSKGSSSDLASLLQNQNQDQPFSDVPAKHWAFNAVEVLRKLGLVAGYPDKLYHGRNPVKLAEFLDVLDRIAKKYPETPKP